MARLLDYDPKKPSERRVRLLMVNPPDFMALFKKGLKIRASLKVVKGVPADAKLLYVSYDHMRAAIVLVVTSETYDLVPLDVVPPAEMVEFSVS